PVLDGAAVFEWDGLWSVARARSVENKEHILSTRALSRREIRERVSLPIDRVGGEVIPSCCVEQHHLLQISVRIFRPQERNVVRKPTLAEVTDRKHEAHLRIVQQKIEFSERGPRTEGTHRCAERRRRKQHLEPLNAIVRQ